MLKIASALLALAVAAGWGAALAGEAPASETRAFAKCPDTACRAEAVARLKADALAGDDYALVSLELLRASGAADAPSLAQIIEIEIARAGGGDAMTAWRLAKRYETGDGVAASQTEMIRWLKVAAAERAYPKAADAAYALCEIYNHGEATAAEPAEARDWCRIAAGAGHAVAVMTLARLRATHE